ncbi:odorant receptor 4-like [Chrysoperla carnea]|uniref:odorant receptor 4-like n=1 Tax=Chrysoperla carnea TaxID=189513 RepID=UPI001D064E82|nr:odorant receptor 4-like [Chrysoperla carnea]
MARHLDDIRVFTKLMGFTLSHVMGAFKIWIWYSKSKEINETVHLIEDSEIFKYETTKTFETDTITMAAIKKSRFVTWVDFILGTALPINASIIAWRTPAFEYVNPSTNTTLQLRTLPYDTWFPFEARTMPYYPIAFFYQAVCTPPDFHCRSDHLYDSPEVEQKMTEGLKKCIIHHQTVIEMTKSVDNIIRFLLFGQFFASMFILCTSLLSLSINKVGSMPFVNEVSYLLAVLFQLFVYCWFGNGITEQSSSVLQALYECNWFSSPTSFKRSLLIMMNRTQRPLRLNIGIFAPLTIQTYVTVLRGSYSYFAVLKQTNLPQANVDE